MELCGCWRTLELWSPQVLAIRASSSSLHILAGLYNMPCFGAEIRNMQLVCMSQCGIEKTLSMLQGFISKTEMMIL
jgi:hypothetical protein